MNEKEYKENMKYETFEQFWDDNYGKEYGYSDKYPSEPYYSIAEYSWEMGENHGYYLGKDYGDTKEIKEDNSIPSPSEFESNILKATNESEEHEERIEKFFNELYTTYKPYLNMSEKYLFDNEQDDYLNLEIRIKDLVLHIEFIRTPNRKYLTYKSHLKFYVEKEWLYEIHCIYSTLTIGLNEQWRIQTFKPNDDRDILLWNCINSYLYNNDENELWKIFIDELTKICIKQVQERKGDCI
jgi:hypothetical protein